VKQEGTPGLGEFVLSVQPTVEASPRRILVPPTTLRSRLTWKQAPAGWSNSEANLSTQQSKEEQETRVQGSDEEQGRPSDPGASPQEVPDPDLGLRSALCESNRPLPMSERSEGRRTLRASRQLRRVLQRGTKSSGSLVNAYTLQAQGPTLTGFVAGRTVGGAVRRNRARRLMREAWRTVSPTVPTGTHMVLVARPAIGTASAPEAAADLRDTLRKGGVVFA
jgi:ribonuclease P protein component